MTKLLTPFKKRFSKLIKYNYLEIYNHKTLLLKIDKKILKNLDKSFYENESIIGSLDFVDVLIGKDELNNFFKNLKIQIQYKK